MKRQRGSALLLMLILLSVAVAYGLLRLSNARAERDQVTAKALSQAKEALIGDAMVVGTGYLRLPDIGTSRDPLPPQQEGRAAANFAGNVLNTSVLGRLPWRSLRLQPLRDGYGECLWYAVSGSFQAGNPASPLNWDTLGHFDTFVSNGSAAGTLSTTAAANPHQRALALLIAPGASLIGQNRSSSAVDAVAECGGNYDARNYLDGVNPDPRLNGIVNYLGGLNNATGNYLAAPKAMLVAPVTDPLPGETLTNDQILSITSDELFRQLQRRPEFKANVDALLRDWADHLNGLAPASLPARSAGNKGIDGVVASFLAAHPVANWPAAKNQFRDNWRNNLLYTRPAGASVVNGEPICLAVLLFAGARTQRTLAPVGPQIRANAAQIGSAAQFGDPAMYLEGGNTIFPAAGNYLGGTHFDSANPSADLLRCIQGLPAGAQQASFNANLPGFISRGSGLSVDGINHSLTLQNAAGGVGGCLWSPTPVTLAGKVWRSYHEFKFSQADNFINSGGTDRGYGLSLQWVTAEPGSPPTTCGAATAMGSLGNSDPWGQHSILIETDVHRDAAAHDPVENHTAILLDGLLDHALVGNTLSTSCDGSSTGCRHTPANLFEESPTQTHSQRVEIHSGCNADCSVCNPAAHVAPNLFVRVSTWVDCKDCDLVTQDLNRGTQPPQLQRCVPLAPALHSVYYGFTGGFLSGAGQQSATVSNFFMRSQ